MSNTNALHWHDHLASWPMMELFEYRFLSFETRLLKPDIGAFEHVAKFVGLPPGRVLFLDDNAVNVEGAAAVGFRGEGLARSARSAQMLQPSIVDRGHQP